MTMQPKVAVLTRKGTNCERGTARAFNNVGANAEVILLNSLIRGYDPVTRERKKLSDYDILAIPGGFSAGDYVRAGQIFATELKNGIGDQVEEFIEAKKPIIGICNGFQVLVAAGYLPDNSGEQTVSLTHNDSAIYECRWVKLIGPDNNCIWTKNIDSIDLPVAHGEGKFVASDEKIKELFDKGQVVFQYADSNGNPTQEFPANPNASLEAIAGICNPTGTIFGLMPHPERYNVPDNHHLAPLQKILSRPYVDRDDPAIQQRLQIAGELPSEGAGLQIFRNGVNYALENLIR